MLLRNASPVFDREIEVGITDALGRHRHLAIEIGHPAQVTAGSMQVFDRRRQGAISLSPIARL